MWLRGVHRPFFVSDERSLDSLNIAKRPSTRMRTLLVVSTEFFFWHENFSLLSNLTKSTFEHLIRSSFFPVTIYNVPTYTSFIQSQIKHLALFKKTGNTLVLRRNSFNRKFITAQYFLPVLWKSLGREPPSTKVWCLRAEETERNFIWRPDGRRNFCSPINCWEIWEYGYPRKPNPGCTVDTAIFPNCSLAGQVAFPWRQVAFIVE